MPKTRLATIRYQALDMCFSDRNKFYYIEDLLRAVNQTLSNNDEAPVTRRTVYSDISAMVLNRDWNVVFEEPAWRNGRRFYRYADSKYSIWRTDLSKSHLSQLKTILIMLEQFRGLPQWEYLEDMISELSKKYGFSLDLHNPIIEFDQNQYVEGLQWLGILFQSIISKQVLKLKYQPYGKKVLTITIHPYYLKQYNSRWFLFGHSTNQHCITNCALDRIKDIDSSKEEYLESDIDFENYFSEMVGVTRDIDSISEKVIIKVSPERIPYIVSKPIHESQRNSRVSEGIIELDVIINRELVQKILSFGKDIEVIEPLNLRLQMQKEVEYLQKMYS